MGRINITPASLSRLLLSKVELPAIAIQNPVQQPMTRRPGNPPCEKKGRDQETTTATFDDGESPARRLSILHISLSLSLTDGVLFVFGKGPASEEKLRVVWKKKGEEKTKADQRWTMRAPELLLLFFFFFLDGRLFLRRKMGRILHRGGRQESRGWSRGSRKFDAPKVFWSERN